MLITSAFLAAIWKLDGGSHGAIHLGWTPCFPATSPNRTFHSKPARYSESLSLLIVTEQFWCSARSFPGKGEGVTIAGSSPSAAAAPAKGPAAPAAPAPAAKVPVAADDDNSDDSDEDLDLFGELTEVHPGSTTLFWE